MHPIKTLLFLSLTVILFSEVRGLRSYGRMKRRCNEICEQFAMRITTPPGGKTPGMTSLKRSLELYFKEKGMVQSQYFYLFRENLPDMMNYLLEEKHSRGMCSTLQFCKKIGKHMDATEYDSCKICNSSMKIVKEALEIVQMSFKGGINIGKTACFMYIHGKVEKRNCYKIMDDIGKLEEKMVKKAENIQVCKLLGFCTNSTSEDKEECGNIMKGASPWSVVLSTVKSFGTSFFSDTKTLKDGINDLKKTLFFSKLSRCMEHLSKQISRRRRSTDVPECPTCQKISNHIESMEGLERQVPTNILKLVCKSLVPPKDKNRCETNSLLKISPQSILSEFLPPELCSKSDCLIQNNSTECEICKSIESILDREAKAAITLMKLVTSQVNSICKKFADQSLVLKCNDITTDVVKFAAMLKKNFTNDKMCKDLGICGR